MSNAAALLAHTHTSPGSPDRPPASLGPCSEDSPEQRLQSTALCGCLRFIQANQKMFPCTKSRASYIRVPLTATRGRSRSLLYAAAARANTRARLAVVLYCHFQAAELRA